MSRVAGEKLKKVILFFSNNLDLKISNQDISKHIIDRSFNLGQLIKDEE